MYALWDDDYLDCLWPGLLVVLLLLPCETTTPLTRTTVSDLLFGKGRPLPSWESARSRSL